MGSWFVKLKTSPEGCAMPTRLLTELGRVSRWWGEAGLPGRQHGLFEALGGHGEAFTLTHGEHRRGMQHGGG